MRTRDGDDNGYKADRAGSNEYEKKRLYSVTEEREKMKGENISFCVHFNTHLLLVKKIYRMFLQILSVVFTFIANVVYKHVCAEVYLTEMNVEIFIIHKIFWEKN